MDAIRINLNTPVVGVKELHPVSMYEANGELLIYFNGTDEEKKGYKECYGISDGQTLLLRRTIGGDYGTTIEAKLKVKKEDIENHVVYTNIPYFPSMRISRYEKFDYNGKTACRLIMDSSHNVFAQDCQIGEIRKLILKGTSNDELGSYNFCIPANIGQRPVTIEDYVYVSDTTEPCGHDFDKKIQWKYDYVTSRISKTSLLLLEAPSDDVLEKACFAEVENSNPIFYTKELENVYDNSGNPVKQCFLFNEDKWLEDIKKNYDNSITANCSLTAKNVLSIGAISSTNLLQDCSYWDVALGLSMDENVNGLGSEDTFGENLVNELKDSAIPGFIDMERVKYIPTNEDGTKIATALTFNFHFLQREFARGNNTSLTSAYTYADGWYVTPSAKTATWWNGMNNKTSSWYEKEMKDFYEKSGSTSDLLGYLNFIDTDVYYRKKKLSKTFLRLKFFTSKDPLTQNLLFSSTIFMDANRLYGDYLKTKAYLGDKSDSFIRYNSPIIWNSANTTAVFFNNPSAVSRLDSHMTVTNEYDNTRSAEGYNLYLFSDDAEVTDSEETDYRTIYMKVEFNHAGNGKTIPMILWPQNGGSFEELTPTNLSESFYIPVHVKYSSKLNRYVYSVPKATYSGETLIFNLFEPKVTAAEKTNYPYLVVNYSARVITNFASGYSATINETEGNHEGGITTAATDVNSAFTFSVSGSADEPFKIKATTKYYNCTTAPLSASVTVTPKNTMGEMGDSVVMTFEQNSGNTIRFLRTAYGTGVQKTLKLEHAPTSTGLPTAATWLERSLGGENHDLLTVSPRSINSEYQERFARFVIDGIDGEYPIFIYQDAAETPSTSS